MLLFKYLHRLHSKVTNITFSKNVVEGSEHYPFFQEFIRALDTFLCKNKPQYYQIVEDDILSFYPEQGSGGIYPEKDLLPASLA